MATVNGTSGRDFIHMAGDGRPTPGGYNDVTGVTVGRETIRAGDGDDIVYGAASNDFVYGEAGDDFIRGEEGNDFLYGEAGDDVIRGDEGTDEIVGGAGVDLIYGGDDNDRVIYYAPKECAKSEIVHGGAGVDLFQIVSSGGIFDMSESALVEFERLQIITGYSINGFSRVDLILTHTQFAQFYR